jgi:hypothetical protein
MRFTPLTALKRTVAVLSNLPCTFCLIGGHAASLYRSQERFTKDVDFAVVATEVKRSRSVAENAIKALGMKPVVGFIPHGREKSGRSPVRMITSAPPAGDLSGIVDILLPEVSWVTEAVERAQHNRMDLGFAMVPVITPEDLIIAKCQSVSNAPDRFQDLDDLKQLFSDVEDLDIDYLRRRLHELALVIPAPIEAYAPGSLRS